MVIVNEDCFTYSFQCVRLLVLASLYLHYIVEGVKTDLPPCNLSPLSIIDVSCRFFIDILYQVEQDKFPSITTWLRFFLKIRNVCWILFLVFPESIEMIMEFFFKFVNMVNYIDFEC